MKAVISRLVCLGGEFRQEIVEALFVGIHFVTRSQSR